MYWDWKESKCSGSKQEYAFWKKYTCVVFPVEQSFQFYVTDRPADVGLTDELYYDTIEDAKEACQNYMENYDAEN